MEIYEGIKLSSSEEIKFLIKNETRNGRDVFLKFITKELGLRYQVVWKIIVKLFKEKEIIYIKKIPCKSCGYIYENRIPEKCLKCGNKIINQKCEFKKRNEFPHYLIRSNNFGMENEKQDNKKKSYFLSVLEKSVNTSNFVQYEKFCWDFNPNDFIAKNNSESNLPLISKFICRIYHRANYKLCNEFVNFLEELCFDPIRIEDIIRSIIEIIINELTGGIEIDWYSDWYYDESNTFINKFKNNTNLKFKMKYLLPLPMNFKLKQKIVKKINMILLDYPLDNG